MFGVAELRVAGDVDTRDAAFQHGDGGLARCTLLRRDIRHHAAIARIPVQGLHDPCCPLEFRERSLALEPGQGCVQRFLRQQSVACDDELVDQHACLLRLQFRHQPDKQHTGQLRERASCYRHGRSDEAPL
jgi:hypothetical protein